MLAEPDRSLFFDINHTRLRAWEWGDPEARPVLAVHGAFDHGRMFDELGPRVAELGFRVIAIDQRGHGDSERINTGQTFGATASDLGCLAKQLSEAGDHDRVGLIGHSMGSSICFTAATAVPEYFSWVVSLDGLGPPAIIFEQDPPFGELTTSMFDYAVKTFSRSERVFASKADMAAQRGAINHRLPADWLEHLVEHGSVPNGDGWSWKWDPTFNVNMPWGFTIDVVLGEFDRMPLPSLVLTGGEDDMWSEMSTEETAERVGLLADARHFTIASGGHYLHLEQPDVVFDHIAAFLTEVAS